MSTRQLDFFALPSELFSWMGEVDQAVPLDFILEVGWPPTGYRKSSLTEVVREAELSTRTFWRFYVTNRGAAWSDDELNPHSLGFVVCEAPRLIDDDTLLLANIGSKSDRYGEALERGPKAHKLFSQIKRMLVKRHLSSPMWVRNIRDPESKGTQFRDLWYSEGAAALLEQGGKLRQLGVANSEFLIRPREPTPGTEP